MNTGKKIRNYLLKTASRSKHPEPLGWKPDFKYEKSKYDEVKLPKYNAEKSHFITSGFNKDRDPEKSLTWDIFGSRTDKNSISGTGNGAPYWNFNPTSLW